MNSQKTLLIAFLCASFYVSSFYCCAEPQNKFFGDDILLIINYHFPYYQSMDLLKKIYSPYLPHIVFYGPQKHPGVEVCEHYQGWFSYKDIGMAMQKYPGYAGYLWINDDLIINPKNFERFDKNKLWMCRFTKLEFKLGYNAIKNWGWWQRDIGYKAVKKAYDQMDPQRRSIISYNIGEDIVAMAYSDIVYIPTQCSTSCIALCSLYAEQNVFLEIALPTICLSLMPIEQIQYIEGKALWYDGSRKHPCDYLNPSVDYVHPIKLSEKANREFIARYFNCAKES